MNTVISREHKTREKKPVIVAIVDHTDLTKEKTPKEMFLKLGYEYSEDKYHDAKYRFNDGCNGEIKINFNKCLKEVAIHFEQQKDMKIFSFKEIEAIYMQCKELGLRGKE